MKKLLVLALVLALSLSLVACGGSKEPGLDDLAALASDLAGGFGDLTSDNNTGDLPNGFGTSDATSDYDYGEVMSYIDQVVSDVDLSSDWPDNEYTRLIPKPDFKIDYTATNANDGFMAAVPGSVGFDQVKAYVTKVKSAGFSVSPYEFEGNGAYTFTASNSAGYLFTIYSMPGTITSITVTK